VSGHLPSATDGQGEMSDLHFSMTTHRMTKDPPHFIHNAVDELNTGLKG